MNSSRYENKQRIFVFLALVIWSVFLWRVIDVVRPSNREIDFNSDTAIPVLMANDQRQITVFDTYYYGSDRWGAWPLLIARLINHSTGFRWSNDSLHAVRAVWLFLGILFLGMLSRRAFLPVVLSGLLATCGLWVLRLRLFDQGQIYPWQIASLLIVWFALRKWFDSDAEDSKRKLLCALVVLGFSLLAVWSSPVSGPLIGVLVIVETFRSLIRTKATGPAVSEGFMALGLAIIAVASEAAWRANYHRYSLKNFEIDFKTNVGLDVGYLTVNLRNQLELMHTFEWTLLIVLAVVVVIGVIVAAGYFWLRGRRDGLERVRHLLTDEVSFTILGTLGVAATNFAIATAVTHVRISDYDNRYLTLTFVFGSISGLLVVWRILEVLVEKTPVRHSAEIMFGFVALAVLIMAFPHKYPAPTYNLRRETALALERLSPNAVLMGGYWESYVFAGLQQQNPLNPLPLEGFMVRMPWIRTDLKNASEVVVEYKHTNAGTVAPAEHIIQYGVRLRLTDARWYENSEYAFARYVRED